MPVAGIVSRVHASGYLVTIDQHRHLVTGFLPHIELERQCAADGQDPKELNVGQCVSAYVKDYQDEQFRLLLTFDTVDREEQTRFLNQVALGEQVIGTVINHGPPGVFVRLDSGFEALIPTWQVPGAGQSPTEDLLRLDDKVIGTVFKKDLSKRHLHISPLLYLNTWNPNESQEPPPDDISEQDEIYTYAEQSPIPPAIHCRRIAVLDDNEGNLTGISEFLNKCGHTVFPTSSKADLFKMLLEESIECAVVDDLVDSETVVTPILQFLTREELPTRIITCSAYYDEDLCQLLLASSGRVIDALLKPVDLHRLAQRADSLDVSSPFEIEDYFHTSEDIQHEATPSALKKSHGMNRENALDQFHRDACNVWPNDKVLLLHRARHALDPEFVHGHRVDESAFKRIRLRLKYSAVADVLNYGKTIDHMDARGDQEMGDSLQELVGVSSMIAAPVCMFERAEYGLFIFRSHPGRFSLQDVNSLRSLVQEACLTLARIGNMETLATDNVRVAAAGLLAGVAHEIGNSVSEMQLKLGSFMDDLPQIENGELSPDKRRRLAYLIRSLHKQGGAIADTLKAFLATMSANRHLRSTLGTLLQEVREIIIPQAQLLHIALVCGSQDDASKLRYPALPIRQSLFNLVLNAVQHLQGCKPAREKRITIDAGIDKRCELPVWISIADTGYGIHERQREEIFDPFFTTRPDGSGLGLYLTRWFLESVGGDVTVHKTVRFQGSEFRVRLPMPK
jgi:signal transduction histidine kinase/DNA-binding response OmpR family regulator